MPGPVGYYRHPSVLDDLVVFVSEDDLWRVPLEGGQATRLTANPGSSILPAFSPDGELVAFSSRAEGPLEAYVMNVDGGAVRRLTWFGGNSAVAGWSDDGSAVVVSSDHQQPFAALMGLWDVPIDGSPPRPRNLGPARSLSHEAGGQGLVIGRNTTDTARWKRYRGGTAGQLWIDRKGNGQFQKLIDLDGSLANPLWIGTRVYFISDHQGHGNIYSCTPTGRNLKRHTDHSDFYARYPSTDGRTIVYHAGADLWSLDVRSDVARPIDIGLTSSRPHRSRKFEGASRHLESVDLHPKGQALAATARGGAHVMDLWEGAPRPLSEGSSVRDRLATWFPDGERLVAVTDSEDEERLVVLRADGTGERRLLAADVGRPFRLETAPDGADRIAVLNERQEVLIVNVKSGQSKLVSRSAEDRPMGMAWSPDGRWLAFGANASVRTSAIFLHDTTTGRTHQVTSGDFRDGYPSFDLGGKYLYFLSWRTFNPVADGAFFGFGFPRGCRPYLIPLAADTPSPFTKEHELARPVGGSPANGSNGAGNGDTSEALTVTIDLDGIVSRIVPTPFAEGRYTAVVGAAGRFFASSVPVAGALGESWRGGPAAPKGLLQAFDFSKGKVEKVMDAISSFTVSGDGKVIGIRAGKKYRVVAASFKEESSGSDEKTRETGWIDLGRLRVEVDPGEEWTQMAREAWRLQRDQFWNPEMSDVDWEEVYRRYAPLIDRIGSRSEFSDFMWEMQGELGTSHAYELGGDYRPQNSWLQGFLGADISFDKRLGRWRIGRVARGDSWDPDAFSPLSAPSVDIVEGDQLLAVDGRTVDGSVSPNERLTDRAGRAVELTVKRGRRLPRRVAVKTLRSESALRYRDWVEANRATVHDATDGQAGYIHIPDMGARGYSEFHRYFPLEVTRQGLVVDVRFNGGGNVSQLLIQKLLRRRVGYDLARHSDSFDPYPADSPLGPMVALTNEYAGSDGDIFSHAFKRYELGPLIGTRTWGGVIGIFPRHALVDGTMTTQPEFSYWFEDVGWGVENYGTDPDIEVEIRPQDYATGKDPQLERGISEVMAQIEALEVSYPDVASRPTRKIPKLPPRE